MMRACENSKINDFVNFRIFSASLSSISEPVRISKIIVQNNRFVVRNEIYGKRFRNFRSQVSRYVRRHDKNIRSTVPYHHAVKKKLNHQTLENTFVVIFHAAAAIFPDIFYSLGFLNDYWVNF